MALTLHDKISESATTCVYRAYDDTLGRDVLLKVLHRHLAHDEQVRQRFIREARACAALRSEHIVQVFDLREHDGSPALIMEFVTGRSLKDVIADGDQRTHAFAEKVAVHVLRGLATAHAHGIIHRDIKPGNILVATSGTVMITDFGLAQVAVAPTLTTEGMIVGTPAYFAPEIIRGETADARTDLFSLGATLAETLTGDRLFEGTTYSDCLNRIAQFKPDMLDPLTAKSSPAFVTFLKTLMHPDRNQRYASPQQALAALGKTSSSQFAVPRTFPPDTRTRRWAGLSIALIAVIIVFGIYGVIRRYDTEPAVSPNVPPVTAERPGTPVDSAVDIQKSNPPLSTLSDQASGKERQRPVNETERAIPTQDSGSVILASTPGAKVHIDDRLIGELPLQWPLRLAAGTHTIVFTHPSFEPILRTVRLDPGSEISITADFLERAGYLRCSVTPWAEVSVDNLYRDTTPFDRPIPLTAGTHRVLLHHPAFRDSVWNVTIAPRETVSVIINLRP